MPKSYCWLAVLSVLAGWTCTEAADTVTIGGVELPADCALARREHPRLLFTKADLPRLRARLEHPRIAAELEHAKQLAAEDKAGAILLGVLYYLTEERTLSPSPVHRQNKGRNSMRFFISSGSNTLAISSRSWTA